MDPSPTHEGLGAGRRPHWLPPCPSILHVGLMALATHRSRCRPSIGLGFRPARASFRAMQTVPRPEDHGTTAGHAKPCCILSYPSTPCPCRTCGRPAAPAVAVPSCRTSGTRAGFGGAAPFNSSIPSAPVLRLRALDRPRRDRPPNTGQNHDHDAYPRGDLRRRLPRARRPTLAHTTLETSRPPSAPPTRPCCASATAARARRP